MPDLDMQRMRNIHFVGIGGCGMSGLAKVLHEMGYRVTGTDTKEGPNTIRLKDLGVKIFIGHNEAPVREADLLVYSSAVVPDNVELMAARAKGIPVLQRAEMLSWIMEQSKQKIAIAGTHGKTTTTAMLAKVLDAGRLKPTYLIGCDMDYVEGNAKLGNGKYAVAEADESDSSFLHLSPSVGVITNIEDDHMERFISFKALVETFKQFADNVSSDGFLVVDANDPNNQEIMRSVKARYITYGLQGEVEYSARNLNFKYFTSRYTLVRAGQDVGEVMLSVPGWQNVLNSLPVFAIGFEFGLDFNFIAGALRSFTGARRRFQIVGKFKDILIIDDYAHHPTEIRATLAAARGGWPGKRIVCVFQPHRYSRTMLLKDQFIRAFGDADKVVITDIYSASEQPIPGISGQVIADGITDKDVEYIPRKEKIADYLMRDKQDGDLVLTLGAGDIYTVAREFFSRLKMK
ncbi:UDP-N-acetylmuramate--L-alanine ligase [Candidatus Margulisiibacteriota bacterium]